MIGRCNFARVLTAIFLVAVVALFLLSSAPSYAQTTTTVPGVPTDFWNTIGHRAVELHWTAPADDGGSPITRYDIRSNADVIATTKNTEHVLDSLNRGIWRLNIRAVNANGVGAWSNRYFVDVNPAVVTITGPTVVSEPASAGEEVLFILTADRPVLSTSRPLNVSVLVSETNDMIWDQDEGAKTVSFPLGTQTATLVVHLTADATHESDSDVTAAIQTNSDYTVGTPVSATVTIIDNDLPPGPPTGVIVVSTTHLDFSISWTAPADVGDAPIIKYQIDNSSSLIEHYDTITTYSDLFYPFTPIAGKDYIIRVRAFNGLGYSDWSDPIVVTPRRSTITVAGNGPVTEGSDAVFILTTDLVNRLNENGQSTLIVNVLVSESNDIVASTNEKVHTVRFAFDATTATLTVPTVDNDRDERDSTITAAIQGSTFVGRSYIYTVGSLHSAEVRVINDDFGNFDKEQLDSWRHERTAFLWSLDRVLPTDGQ